MAVLPLLVAVLMLMDGIASAPTPLAPRTQEESEKDIVRLSDTILDNTEATIVMFLIAATSRRSNRNSTSTEYGNDQLSV